MIYSQCSQILKFILFADDTNIFYSNPDIDLLFKVATEALCSVSAWFKVNKLVVNAKKTNVMLFAQKVSTHHI